MDAPAADPCGLSSERLAPQPHAPLVRVQAVAAPPCSPAETRPRDVQVKLADAAAVGKRAVPSCLAAEAASSRLASESRRNHCAQQSYVSPSSQ